jgi:glycerol-1-phosphate dehydrogenase [NAD(P)+]
MTSSPPRPHLDPRDVASVSAALRIGTPGSGLHPIGIRRIEIGPRALDTLPEIVADVRRPGAIALLTDATPMTRHGSDLKAHVRASLTALGEVRPIVLGDTATDLHADAGSIAAARSRADGAGCLVAVGSGTICDIGKEASRELGLPYVVVQTANSVNAFSDDMAVLLINGVKRTVPSRWPDALIVDLAVLADAPPALNQAGVGELASMFTAPADWRLANALGMDDTFDRSAIDLFRDGAPALLEAGNRLAAGDLGALEPLAELMTLSGIALGVAGRTAPISGTEHTASHLLDMAAAQHGRATGLHGAQVGVASLVVAVAWARILPLLDPEAIVATGAPDPVAMRARVDAAFMPLDATGAMADECWSQYARKLDRWGRIGDRGAEIVDGWDALVRDLRTLLVPPEAIAGLLRGAGAPATFGEIDPPVPVETGVWAILNGHLQRDRFAIADLALHAGLWTETFVRAVVEEAAALAGRAATGTAGEAPG